MMIWSVFAVVIISLVIFINHMKKERDHEVLIAIYESLYSIIAPFRREGYCDIDNSIINDDYLIGMMHSMVALQVNLLCPDSSKAQRGDMLIEVVRRAFPTKWESLILKMNGLAFSENPEYRRGGEHAANVVGLAQCRLKPEIMAEPEIQKALSSTPAASLGPSSYGTASGLLMLNYLLEHRLLKYEKFRRSSFGDSPPN